METLEGQLAYIESALKHAKAVTTGHTQMQVTRSLDMMPLVRVAVQNMAAKVSRVEEQE